MKDGNVRGFLVLALIAGIGVLLYLLRDILTPFAIAFALAYFMNPAANRLEAFLAKALRHAGPLSKLSPRSIAVALLAALALVAFAAVVLFVIPALYHQLAEAVGKLPHYVSNLKTKLEPAIQRLNLRYPEQSEEVRAKLQEAIQAHLLDVVSPATKILTTTFSSALSMLLAFIDFLIIPVFGMYLLHDMNRIRDGAYEWIPPRFRDYLTTRMSEMDALLSAFARGLITVCFIMGTIYAIGFTIVGVPMGLLVGLLVGFFNVVPFMSYVVGMPLALLLSWLDDQSPSKLLAVVLICTAGQFLEANLITPRIVGEKLGVHAIVILLAVLVGGSLFGVSGMILALPVTAALSIFWGDVKEAYTRSRFYTGASD